jgi:hypothetical protein
MVENFLDVTTGQVPSRSRRFATVRSTQRTPSVLIWSL